MTTIPAQTREAGDVEPRNGVLDVFRGYFERVLAGDVGSLPVFVALIAITLFFQAKSGGLGFDLSLGPGSFLTPSNFNNVMVQMATVTTIAYGVVFVLLLGEIDLSIGFVSGVAGVIAAKLQIPDGSWEVTGVWAILIAMIVCALIGAFQGSFVALIGVPSFVVTLAGLLAWQGVVQKAIGSQGVIGIEDNTLNNIANYFFSDTWGWILAGAGSAFYAGSKLTGVVSRRMHGIRTDNLTIVALKILAIAGIAFLAVHVSNQERGFPFAGVMILVLLVFWTYVGTRTTFGRHVYAVGGNAEAARRAGINVPRIRIEVFMISGAMAALGGVVAASRLNSVDLNAGGGTLLLDAIAAAVIGGTSLFGGRGEVKSALLGALVIATIANGIDLIGSESATKFIVTGIILLAAVTLDTLSRRRLEKVGR
jgi:D-xylose transport system permease protein